MYIVFLTNFRKIEDCLFDLFFNKGYIVFLTKLILLGFLRIILLDILFWYGNIIHAISTRIF